MGPPLNDFITFIKSFHFEKTFGKSTCCTWFRSKIMQKSEKTGTVALNGHGWILASFHQTQQMFMEGGGLVWPGLLMTSWPTPIVSKASPWSKPSGTELALWHCSSSTWLAGSNISVKTSSNLITWNTTLHCTLSVQPIFVLHQLVQMCGRR